MTRVTRERELKFDLGDQETARRLEALLLGKGSPLPMRRARWQVNRFFDTDDRSLRRARLALRLRGEWTLAADEIADPDAPSTTPRLSERAPDRLILSLKGPRAGQDGFHDREELQTEAPPHLWQRPSLPLDSLPDRWRDRLPLTARGEPGLAAQRRLLELKEVARFANLRQTLPLAARWRAEIDRTWFGDGRRAWELEVEIGPGEDPDGVRTALADLLRDEDIVLKPQERSKLERALADSGD